MYYYYRQSGQTIIDEWLRTKNLTIKVYFPADHVSGSSFDVALIFM